MTADDQPRLKVDRLARAMAVARSRAGEPDAADPVAGRPGTGTPVRGDAGPAPLAASAAPLEPGLPTAAAPLILTPELMRVPPAGGIVAPAPAPAPAAPAVAPIPATLAPAPAPAAAEAAAPGGSLSGRAFGPAVLRPRPAPDPAPEAPVGAASGPPPGPAPLPRLGPPLLSLSGVAIAAPPLASVGFDVPAGGVTVLLGTPGGAASALLRGIMGLEPLAAGQVRLDGQDITRWRPRRIARAGVGYLPGDLGLFPGLSVAENLSLGALAARLPRDRLDAVFRLFPALRPVWHLPARELDRAGAQTLALARLMAERHRIYLVDTVGLADGAEVPPALGAALRELKLQRATILMAAQSLPLAAALGDTCVALAAGRVAWSGPMAVMAEDAELQARCLGPGGVGR